MPVKLAEPMSGSFVNAGAAAFLGALGVYFLTIGKKENSAARMAFGAALIIAAMFVF